MRKLTKSQRRHIDHAAKLSKQMGNPDPIKKIREAMIRSIDQE
jgi:hypothetical protein